jgi:hypothetical protein
LVAQLIRSFPCNSGLIRFRVSRSPWLGTEIRISLTPSRHSLSSVVAFRLSGNAAPGRYRVFSASAAICFSCRASRPQIRTGRPPRANCSASAVPHEPAPMTAIGEAPACSSAAEISECPRFLQQLNR